MHLFASLARYLPPDARHGRAVLEVAEGTTVGDLLRRLAIPEDLPRLLLLNGQEARPDRVLAAGDVVAILPPLAGGR